MKLLRNLLEKTKPHFVEGGKLSRFHVVYDGLATFLFTPDHVTVKGSHIRDGIDLKRTMFLVIVALVPCLLFGIWNTGHQHFLALGQFPELMDGFADKIIFGLWKVLPMVVVSYGAGLGVEFIFAGIKRHGIHEGYLVSGMLIPLIMPVDVPLWMVAVASIFAVVIGKEVFGGTGMNILNVALTARAFLFFAYPTKMSGDKVWVSLDGATSVDGFTGATALGDLATTVSDPSAASQVAAKFAPDGAYNLMDSFFGFIPGSIGETSVIACLIGAAILLFTGIGSWRIMASVFVGGFVMGYIFNLAGVNEFMLLDPLHQLMIGGFMFGMVFMATDPVTAAQTNTGKYIYGFFIGLFAILFRVFNPAYPEGMMLSILFMNVMAPIIDHYIVQSNIKRREKRMKVAV